jgi:hypothetical protein
LRHFGFGPVSGDGFGLGYIIKEDSISVCASSKHRQTKRFIDSIESYLNEVRRLLKATKQRDSHGPKTTRAREAEEKAGRDGRLKSRGRVIKADSYKLDSDGKGIQTPTSIDTAEVEDDGLGGCKLLRVVSSQGITDICTRRLFRCWDAAASVEEEGRASSSRSNRAATKGGGQETGFDRVLNRGIKVPKLLIDGVEMMPNMNTRVVSGMSQ